MSILVISKSKGPITAKPLGRSASIRRCGFCFRRTGRGGSPEPPAGESEPDWQSQSPLRLDRETSVSSLQPLAVDLIDAHEPADEIDVFLIGKSALTRRPGQ